MAKINYLKILRQYYILDLSIQKLDSGYRLHGHGDNFKKIYLNLNLSVQKYSSPNNMHVLQCMANMYCVAFQRLPWNFKQISYPCIQIYDSYTAIKL